MITLHTSAKVLAVTLIGLSVVGCSNTGPKQGIGTVAGAIAGGVIGNQFGKGSGNVVATAAGAVIGGLIGSEIGRALDERDQQLAYNAQYSALERGRSGAPVEWRNPDSGHSGRVVPQKAYTVNNRQCRDYTHTVYIDGQPETARGTACREADGTWRTVS
ncbi:RT0821/Lpp0805 family surface protein [Coralliovum pocilloporae]|uniref:RT0821/Lpp0805 family surface protein n=1 Tax=Coralliovum pocilloporae TaxID=3066369 RepID=UPI003307C1B3